MRRRSFLALPALLAARAALAPAAGAAQPSGGEPYAPVVAGRALAFPRDHGAHPAYRTEWWYITGWLHAGRERRELGFQVTFFRNRPRVAEDNPSAFAARQLLFAHAALADPLAGRLVHEQRSARAGFGIAAAGEADTALKLDDWSLARGADGYRARIRAREFDLALEFAPSQPILLQGDRGTSRKGPRPQQASYYYSWPQLAARGRVLRGGAALECSGVAWLDHEWSSEALAPEAAGWDWCGVNGEDGSSFMAFRIRARDGGGAYWAGGSHRSADGRLRMFAPHEVLFEPVREWRSPRTGTRYPVSVRVSAGGVSWLLEPLLEDQELDARASTGTVYWEGAVRSREAGRIAGLGYLELTGYWKPLRL